MEAIGYVTRVGSKAGVDATDEDEVETRLARNTVHRVSTFEAVGHCRTAKTAISSRSQIVKVEALRTDHCTNSGERAD